ncbi:MAG TPA: hypothetical protein VGN12_12195 [Pirellulales bacterium]|jgi:hypothetical protein
MIDLGAAGAVLNSSSPGDIATNDSVISGIISNIVSQITAHPYQIDPDCTITWSGDLYTSQTIVFPQISYNGTNSVYFGISGQQATRLMYTGTGWAIQNTYGTAAQSLNDLYSRLLIENLTIQAPYGNGLYQKLGGKSCVFRSIFIAFCGQGTTGGYGAHFEEMDGSFFDDIQTNGCWVDGFTLVNCHQVTANRIESANNGNDGIVISNCAAVTGNFDAEANGRYGLNVDSVSRSTLTIWQEANRMLETKNSGSGLQGVLARNPSSPSGAIYPVGNTGEILPQGSLTNSARNVISGQYGQDSNTDFDTDTLSRGTCSFPSDWRSQNLSSPWQNVCPLAGLVAKGWTSGQIAVTINSGGITGKNTLAVQTGAFASGTPANYGFEIRCQDNNYPGQSGGTSFYWNAGDSFAVDMTITADSGTYSYLWNERHTNLNDVQSVFVAPLSGVGLDTINQYWYLPESANAGPAKFRMIGNATAAGGPSQLRFFIQPLRFLASGPSQVLNLTISDINVYYLPANNAF